MRTEEILAEDDERARELYVRAKKLCHEVVEDKWNDREWVACRLAMLCYSGWYSDPYTWDMVQIQFDTLSELDLKLTILGV